MVKLSNHLLRQDPAYRLYTSDFLVRNHELSDEQAGKFIRLLCYQHQNGHMTEATMKSFCKGNDELVFSRFVKDKKGLFYNEEMEMEKLRRAEVSKRKSENARKRWEKTDDKQPPLPEKINTHIPELDDN